MRIFSLDNAFGKFMDKVFKWSILNGLCIICCIPILTVGPAITALYSMLMRMAKDEEIEIVKDYIHAFRRNFKQAFVIQCIMLVVAIILLLSLYYSRQLQKEYMFYKYWENVMYVVAFVYIMVLTYVYPLIAVFDNTVGETLKNALLLPVIHIGRTVLMVVVTVVPLYLSYVNADIMKWAILFYVICGFAVTTYIHSLILRGIFNQYLKKDKIINVR